MEPDKPETIRPRNTPDEEAVILERHERAVGRAPSKLMGFRTVPVTWHQRPSDDFIKDGIFLLPSVQGRVRFHWRDVACSHRIPTAMASIAKEIVLLCPVNIINKVPKWLPYSIQTVFVPCEQPVSKIWFTALSAPVLFLCTADSKLLTQLWAAQFLTPFTVPRRHPEPSQQP
jgi:hypothetical protein